MGIGRGIWVVEAINLENDMILFKFENLDTKNWVLEGGPWFISQRPLLLKVWTSDISFEPLIF